MPTDYSSSSGPERSQRKQPARKRRKRRKPERSRRNIHPPPTKAPTHYPNLSNTLLNEITPCQAALRQDSLNSYSFRPQLAPNPHYDRPRQRFKPQPMVPTETSMVPTLPLTTQRPHSARLPRQPEPLPITETNGSLSGSDFSFKEPRNSQGTAQGTKEPQADYPTRPGVITQSALQRPRLFITQSDRTDYPNRNQGYSAWGADSYGT